MIDPRFWSIERAAGFFLVLGNVALLPGVLMFWIRGGTRGGAPPSPAYLVWERSFVMAAVVLTAIGFVLLEGYLQNTDGRILARMGATAYLFAGTFVVAAEALSLTLGFEKLYQLIVIYVVLAFLDRPGHHPLEPRVAGRASGDLAARHLFSRSASFHAPPGRHCIAVENTVTASALVLERPLHIQKEIRDDYYTIKKIKKGSEYCE